MFEDYYFDDPALQDALAAAGYYTDPARAPAVMPSTVQAEPIMGIGSPAAVAPMTYEELADRRAAANTPPPGTSIVGPTAGKKGLSFGDDNTFDVYDEQEVRVVDGKGNVIFSGVGVEGANRAVAVGQSLSDDLGKNANFKIQKAERTISNGSVGPDRYIDVAYAAPSQSGLGFLADNVLPFAASFIPVIGPVAGAALGSAVSSGLQGRSLQDALTRAAIAGGSAYAGGQLFGPATSGAGASGAGAATTSGNITNSAIPTGAFDGILVNATRAVAPSILASTAGNAIGQAVASQVGAPNKNNVVDGVDQDTGDIVAIGTKPYLSPEALANIMATFGGEAIPTFDPNAPIDVTGTKIEKQPVEREQAGIGTPGFIDPITGDIVVSKPQPVEREGDIVVSGRLPTTTPSPIPGFGSAIPAITQGALKPTQTGPDPEKSTLDKIKDAAKIASTAAAVLPIIGGIAGAGGGGSGGGAIVPKGGTYDVNPNRSDTFGTRGIANIGFDPFTYGQASGNQPTEFMFFTRDPVTGAATASPIPITTPVANQPAAPAMVAPSGNTFAEGGEIDDDMASHLMAYHKNGGHTGPGQVKGIGSGQEDKIAAWLSDGEYVWSAQDVADLGDGSTDEGVRRLDKMRHMVRRRAGRKDVKKIAKPQKGIDHMLKAVGGSK